MWVVLVKIQAGGGSFVQRLRLAVFALSFVQRRQVAELYRTRLRAYLDGTESPIGRFCADSAAVTTPLQHTQASWQHGIRPSCYGSIRRQSPCNSGLRPVIDVSGSHLCPVPLKPFADTLSILLLP